MERPLLDRLVLDHCKLSDRIVCELHNVLKSVLQRLHKNVYVACTLTTKREGRSSIYQPFVAAGASCGYVWSQQASESSTQRSGQLGAGRAGWATARKEAECPRS